MFIPTLLDGCQKKVMHMEIFYKDAASDKAIGHLEERFSYISEDEGPWESIDEFSDHDSKLTRVSGEVSIQLCGSNCEGLTFSRHFGEYSSDGKPEEDSSQCCGSDCEYCDPGARAQVESSNEEMKEVSEEEKCWRCRILGKKIGRIVR